MAGDAIDTSSSGPHRALCKRAIAARLSCWAVIPVKSPPDRKSRLAGALGREARDRLVIDMAGHVIAAARAVAAVDVVAILASSPEGLPVGTVVIADPGAGLSAAAAHALAGLAGDGVARMVLIAGDLPLVSPEEIAALVAVPANAIALAPDRHDTGTNALSLPLPAALGFTFAFGAGSFAKHCAEAQRLALPIVTVRSKGLQHDVDEPADLVDAPAMLDPPMTRAQGVDDAS